MKTVFKITALIMAMAMVCFVFISCGEKEEGSTVATHYHSGTQYATANYDEVATEVEYEDDKTMTVLMKDITAGKYDNQVVEIEGFNTRYGESCGILEKNEDGTLVGAMYYLIDGVFPTDYPEKDAHIKLRGLVVVDESNGARHLEVPKDQLQILD